MSHLKFKTTAGTSWATATNPLLANRCLRDLDKITGQNQNTISTVVSVIPFSKPLSKTAINFINKIENFSKLSDNWDGYGAVTTKIGTIEKAKQFVRVLDNQNFPLYFVALGPNGEIMIELKKGRYSVELEFDIEGRFAMRYFFDSEYRGESLDENIALISLESFLSHVGKS